MKKVFFVGSLAEANKTLLGGKKKKPNNFQVIAYQTNAGMSVANFELPRGAKMTRDTNELVLRFPMKNGDVLVLGDEEGEGYKGNLQ